MLYTVCGILYLCCVCVCVFERNERGGIDTCQLHVLSSQARVQVHPSAEIFNLAPKPIYSMHIASMWYHTYWNSSRLGSNAYINIY